MDYCLIDIVMYVPISDHKPSQRRKHGCKETRHKQMHETGHKINRQWKENKKHIDLSLWMHRLPSRVWVSDGNPGFALGDGLWSGEGVSME